MNTLRNTRHVGLDIIDGLRVSSVRLSVDYGWDGKPLWYETMVFRDGDWSDLACERYETEDEARAGHTAMCERVRAGEFRESKEGATE